MSKRFFFTLSIVSLLVMTSVDAMAQTVQRQVMPLSQYRAYLRSGAPISQLHARPAPRALAPRPVQNTYPPVSYSHVAPPQMPQPVRNSPATPPPLPPSPAYHAVAEPLPVAMPLPVMDGSQESAAIIPASRETIAPRQSFTPPVEEAARGVENPDRMILPPGFDLNVSTGLRRDNADWNIASDPTGTQTPNILSELTWDSVDSYQVKGEVSYTQRTGLLRGLYGEASGYKAWTFSGENQDSDYFGDNRTLEFSRSNNDSSDGDMHGFKGAVGYAFEVTDRENFEDERHFISIMPLVGYGQDQQYFTMTDGFQTWPPTGSFDGLQSSYEMEWKGAFVGTEFDGYFDNRRYHLKIRGEYHFGDYEGVGNWNLRPEFRFPDSFIHEADATGFVLNGRLGYMAFDNLELFLSGAFTDWTTDAGLDRTFFDDGRIIDIQLNEANWVSTELMIGAAWRW